MTHPQDVNKRNTMLKIYTDLTPTPDSQKTTRAFTVKTCK
jgi:hypothetical protein